MPCTPITLNPPTGPSGPAIPGFGVPFSLPIDIKNPFPPGFPEDLLGILNLLNLLIPPGALMPQLNPNFGKDIFDAIMKLLDQFMPFLMLYKFFLPILKMIICIIEVLCALMNPFKLIDALINLFTNCLPEFLNLFPIFAIIIMLISLLLLIIALIEYIVEQILLFVELILREILALQVAFTDGDANGVLLIAQKLGAMLCIFQNLFVLFAIFDIIIQVIKDILSLAFAIPPCDDGSNCCTSDVCPVIVQNTYTNDTGTFKYLPEIGLEYIVSGATSPYNVITSDIRAESWQLYDVDQTIAQQFRNIFDGYDVVADGYVPPPTYFPTSGVFNASTVPSQAPYTVNLRLFYNPTVWGERGASRYIRINNCIVTAVPTVNLVEGDLSTQTVYSGVASLAGGLAYEDDGTTAIITSDGYQGTLENLIHKPGIFSSPAPTPSLTDGYVFSNVTYTFTPNIAPLIAANLITAGCSPNLAISKAFVNTVVAGDIALKTQAIKSLVNGSSLVNGPSFPSPAAAQQCLATAVASLRSDMTAEGVANFQATANICLQTLKDNTNYALGQLVGIGFQPCKSTLTATPTIQFTSQPIVVTVGLNETNGLPLTRGLSSEIATDIASRITPHITFGNISPFTYDGYQYFNANINSVDSGSGQLMVSFDNNTLCTNVLPANVSVMPTHSLQTIDYQFIYTPTAGNVGIIPVRDPSDVVRDGADDGTSGSADGS